MAKIHTYEVFKSGSVRVCDIRETCITKACMAFAKTLHKPISYKTEGTEYATMRYKDSGTIRNNFVIMLKE